MWSTFWRVNTSFECKWNKNNWSIHVSQINYGTDGFGRTHNRFTSKPIEPFVQNGIQSKWKVKESWRNTQTSEREWEKLI